MRTLLLWLGLGAGAALAVACDDADSVDCECAEVGCFAPMCTRLAFVLAEPVSPKFGGVSAADQMCAQQAQAAGLPGTYYAWLGHSGGGPADRFSRASVPYTLPDGTLLAADWDALTREGPDAAIDMTAAGKRVEAEDDARVWTGTNEAGDANTYNNASNYCSDWTRNVIGEFAVVGFLRDRSKIGAWALGNLVPCTGKGYVYCFQQ
ncbi:MAG TPA: hypothetical protein VGB85_34320 [Nannocystis sp.]|jgi:hypothetical protein